MVVLKLRKQTRPRRADPMRQPPTLVVLLLSDNIMNIFLWMMDVKVRDNACSDVLKEFHVWERRGGRVVDVQYVHNDFDLESKCVRNDQVTHKPTIWGNDLRIVHRIYLNTQYVYVLSTMYMSFSSGTHRYRTFTSIRYSQEGLRNPRQNTSEHLLPTRNRKMTKNLLTETNLGLTPNTLRKQKSWKHQLQVPTTQTPTTNNI